MEFNFTINNNFNIDLSAVFTYLSENPVLCAGFLGLIALGIGAIVFFGHVVLSPIFNRIYWLKKAAKDMNISVTEARMRFHIIVSRAKTYGSKEMDGKSIRLSCYYYYGKRTALAASSSIIRVMRSIRYSPIWIYYTLTCSSLWEVAFYQTVGHELTHLSAPKQGFFFWMHKKHERRFFNWLLEVYCDFGGVAFIQKHFDGYDKETLLHAMEKKATVYDANKKNKESQSHPAWELRLQLLRDHDEFDIHVVRAVAKAAGCELSGIALQWVRRFLPNEDI